MEINNARYILIYIEISLDIYICMLVVLAKHCSLHFKHPRFACALRILLLFD